MDNIFFIAILIMSIVIHEVSHGFAALYFDDRTALYAGRLTLNPLKHLDMFGSVLLPLVLVLTNAPFLFGWAKPVPYNPENLNNKRLGTLAVASAGVLSNIFLAVFFGLILRFSLHIGVSMGFVSIMSVIVLVNLGLAIFNLLPLAPLDGSKIFSSLLPRSFHGAVQFLEQYSFILLLLFIVFFSHYLSPVIGYLFHVITGLAF